MFLFLELDIAVGEEFADVFLFGGIDGVIE
jgi:hypothetical protein